MSLPNPGLNLLQPLRTLNLIWWKGTGSGSPSKPVIGELRESVVGFLNSMTLLTALVGNRIYFEDPSQLALYPCVVVQVTKRTYGHNLAGPDGTSLATVQITTISGSESSGIAIAEVVRNNMDGFRGFQSPVPILRCLYSDEADTAIPPPTGSDQWIYQVALEYEIAHRV